MEWSGAYSWHTRRPCHVSCASPLPAFRHSVRPPLSHQPACCPLVWLRTGRRGGHLLLPLLSLSDHPASASSFHGRQIAKAVRCVPVPWAALPRRFSPRLLRAAPHIQHPRARSVVPSCVGLRWIALLQTRPTTISLFVPGTFPAPTQRCSSGCSQYLRTLRLQLPPLRVRPSPPQDETGLDRHWAAPTAAASPRQPLLACTCSDSQGGSRPYIARGRP